MRRLQQGLTEEQIHGELYNAWLKDVREPSSPDMQKAFRDIAERCIKEREIRLKGERIGINVCVTLSSLLHKANIVHLDLSKNVIRDAGCESLSHYLREDRSLTYLDLGGNDIGSVGIHALVGSIAAHPKLHTLILGSGPKDANLNRIDAIAARLLVEKCRSNKTLKVLDLSRNPIGHGSQEVFPALQQLILTSTTLQVLKLADTCMTTESALGIVEATGKSTTLNHLDISSNNLGVAVVTALGTLILDRSAKSTASCLKSLILGNNPSFGEGSAAMGKGVAALFRALAKDKGLLHLALDNCGVDDVSLEVLCESLRTNKVLDHLELQRSFITEAGTISLARSLLEHPALTYLNLAFNRIRDEGVCALASMLEANHTLQTLDISETWTGDRGLIALGVALSSNTTLTSLSMSNNHMSDDGGTAFVALLDKNKSLHHCCLRGNSMFHCTVMQASKLASRNRQIKADEIPNKLRKEVIKLHYQRYKLEEAKNELQNQKAEKMKIDKAQEEFEAKFRGDEAEFRKKQKELLEQIAAADAQGRAAEKELATILESFKKHETAHEGEMIQLKERYEAEVKEREKAEGEFRAHQQEVEEQDKQRHQRLEDMKQRIQAAKDDRDRWAAQTKEYRAQAEQATARLKELEALAPTTGGKSPKAPKKPKGKKGGKATKAADDIAKLLDTTS